MSVKIDGLDKVSKKLGNLARFSQWAAKPVEKAAALVHDEVAKYPQKRPGAFSALATQAQKRAYWAKVRSGEINHREGVGYVRSGTLGRKWKVEISYPPNGVRAEIGNNTAYAKYVQGKENQQLFHFASGWVDEEEAINKKSNEINRIFQQAINDVLNK